MSPTTLVLLALIAVAHCALQCPNNTTYFDLESCNPERRSQCPSSFTCRRGVKTEAPTEVVHLCCDSQDMTASEWFSEWQLSPQVVPQLPIARLRAVRLVNLDERTLSPSVIIGDEVIALSFPNYATGMISVVEFENATVPPTGGMLHVLTIINPTTKPFSIFFNYNIPSEGLDRLDIQSLVGVGGRGFIAYQDNSTVKSDYSYRYTYVVLVHRTTSALPTDAFVDVMRGCDELACFFINPLGQTLGQPLAASAFHLTTVRSPFPTVEWNSQASPPDNHAPAYSFITLLILSILLQ